MLALLFYAIYVQVLHNTKGKLSSISFGFEISQLLFLFLAFVLIAFNFFCETKKWLTLTNFFYKLPFSKAYKAILAGTTMAFFTPNRVGEYGGRVLFVPRKHIAETIGVTMVGGLAQQITTLFTGLVSIFFLKDVLLEKQLFSETQLGLVTLINLVLLIATVLVYFNVGFVVKALFKIKWLKKYEQKLKTLQQYKKTTLLKVILWASLKYIIFSVQFFCLIYAFGLPFKIELVWLSMFSFLLQTIIPSVSFLELGIRGNIILFTFGAFTHLKIEILTASIALWTFNLLIPAIIGAFFIMKIKID